jgi:uncharacterized protein (DUF2237 family)
MTFEDLGIEYSEAGAAVVSLFGKKDLAVTTVQAELLRTSFLKFTKNVAESVSMVMPHVQFYVYRPGSNTVAVA